MTVATRHEIKSIDLDYFEVEDDGSAAAEPDARQLPIGLQQPMDLHP